MPKKIEHPLQGEKLLANVTKLVRLLESARMHDRNIAEKEIILNCERYIGYQKMVERVIRKNYPKQIISDGLSIFEVGGRPYKK
jgi:hypothetical protein